MLLDFLSPDDIVADPEDAPGFRYGVLRKKDRHTSTKDRHTNRTFNSRPFIAVDGEGGGNNELGQQNYLLMRALGTNDYTARLFNRNTPLLMIQCLEFLLALPQYAILVGFFFYYDATQILRDLSVNRLTRLLSEYAKGAGLSPYTMVTLEGQHLIKQSMHIVRVVKKRHTSIQFTIRWNSQTVELEDKIYDIGNLPKPYTTWIREVKDPAADNNARMP